MPTPGKPHFLTLTDEEGVIIDRWDMDDDEDVFQTLVTSDNVTNSTRRKIERILEERQASWEEQNLKHIDDAKAVQDKKVEIFLSEKSPEDIKNYEVGDAYVVWAGAPGTGKWIYRVTRIDKDGIWGVEEHCDVRELSPDEVV